MSQQELLLLMLGIVVVGFAFWTGSSVFGRSMEQRQADLLMNHAVHVASDAVAWRSKPSPFLGGGSSYADLDPNGLATMGMTEERAPGIVRITYASKDSLVITAVSTTLPNVGAQIHISGTEIAQTSLAYDGSIVLPEK